MAEQILTALTILRRPAVLKKRGDSKSTFHDHIKRGLWPRPVHLSERARGWPQHECDMVIAARIAGKSDEEIRELVAKLEAERKALA